MIISCPKCGNKISDKAKKCPHCGFVFEENEKLSLKNKLQNYEDLDVGKTEELGKQFQSEYPELAQVQKHSLYRFYAIIALWIVAIVSSSAFTIFIIIDISSSVNVAIFIFFAALALVSLIACFVLSKIQKKNTGELIKLDKYFKYWLEKRGFYYSSAFDSGEDKKIYESIVVELKEDKR